MLIFVEHRESFDDVGTVFQLCKVSGKKCGNGWMDGRNSSFKECLQQSKTLKDVQNYY
jgi:hypothetical protein